MARPGRNGAHRDRHGCGTTARVVGRELNVGYLAEWEIRRAGDKLVLETMLSDTGSATRVRTDRLDTPVTQVGAGNDAIATQLAADGRPCRPVPLVSPWKGDVLRVMEQNERLPRARRSW